MSYFKTFILIIFSFILISTQVIYSIETEENDLMNQNELETQSNYWPDYGYGYGKDHYGYGYGYYKSPKLYHAKKKSYGGLKKYNKKKFYHKHHGLKKYKHHLKKKHYKDIYFKKSIVFRLKHKKHLSKKKKFAKLCMTLFNCNRILYQIFTKKYKRKYLLIPMIIIYSSISDNISDLKLFINITH